MIYSPVSETTINQRDPFLRARVHFSFDNLRPVASSFFSYVEYYAAGRSCARTRCPNLRNNIIMLRRNRRVSWTIPFSETYLRGTLTIFYFNDFFSNYSYFASRKRFIFFGRFPGKVYRVSLFQSHFCIFSLNTRIIYVQCYVDIILLYYGHRARHLKLWVSQYSRNDYIYFALLEVTKP